MVDVLFWNKVVNQECSSQYSNLEHSGQTGVQWWMFQSGTQLSNKQEGRGGNSNL